jgi:hypothetical protein
VTANPGDPNQRQEIKSSLNSTVEIADRWLKRIRRRQLQVRIITTLLTIFLVFFGTLIFDAIILVFSANLVSMSGPTIGSNFNNYIVQHPGILFSLVGPAFLTAPISGIVVYLLLRWRHNSQLKELASLTTQMKKKLEDYDRQQIKSPISDQGFIEYSFSLMDRILTLLPEIVRKRNTDSLLFGVVAFILGSIVANSGGVGLVVGVLVWLYFRHETKKSYEREIAKFEEQKKIYEKRKNDFLETL